jgi:hypothetical protein
MRALEAVSRPGDVVLQRPGGRYPPAPVVLAGRRVTYERFTPYLTQFVPKAELEKRHVLVRDFFRTRDRAEALAIARSLGASYVALYGSDRVRFDAEGILEPVHEEPGARVYRIVNETGQTATTDDNDRRGYLPGGLRSRPPGPPAQKDDG